MATTYFFFVSTSSNYLFGVIGNRLEAPWFDTVYHLNHSALL